MLEDVNYTPAESVLNFYYWIDWDGDEVPDDDMTELPFPGYAPKPFGPYALGNFGGGTAEELGQPKRDYEALEILLNKRLSNNWQLTANYRYARLRGNYEGLYRNDNGQADPNVTSLFDFPDTPFVHGQYQAGALNTDRPHVLNIFGVLSLRPRVRAGRGIPVGLRRAADAALGPPRLRERGGLPGTDPRYLFYDFDAGLSGLRGPGSPAGSWATTMPSPAETSVARQPDHARSPRRVGDPDPRHPPQAGARRHDVFNRQAAQTYYDDLELMTCVGNPDYGSAMGYQAPRSYTLTLEWSW